MFFAQSGSMKMKALDKIAVLCKLKNRKRLGEISYLQKFEKKAPILMLLLILRYTTICKLGSLQGYEKKRKMNEFLEKKNGKVHKLRPTRLS